MKGMYKPPHNIQQETLSLGERATNSNLGNDNHLNTTEHAGLIRKYIQIWKLLTTKNRINAMFHLSIKKNEQNLLQYFVTAEK